MSGYSASWLGDLSFGLKKLVNESEDALLAHVTAVEARDDDVDVAKVFLTRTVKGGIDPAKSRAQHAVGNPLLGRPPSNLI
ncbi:hypothetical protein HG531_000635 [Fusarium graminearum]|nr:hypothetical protein HG531_000635 [Fusarium graminearum]